MFVNDQNGEYDTLWGGIPWVFLKARRLPQDNLWLCEGLLAPSLCRNPLYLYHFENLWRIKKKKKKGVFKCTLFEIGIEHVETLLTCLLCSLYNLSIFNLKNLPDWPNSVFSLCSPRLLLPIKPQILCNNWNRKLKMVFMMWGPELFPFCVFVFPQHSENCF